MYYKDGKVCISALNTWKGQHRFDAQEAFLNRAKNNSLATLGEY